MARRRSTASSPIRPLPEDHDEWGLPAGGGMTCCPRIAGSRPTTTSADDAWHGVDGPMPIFRHPGGAMGRGRPRVERSGASESATAGAPTTTRRRARACRLTPSMATPCVRSGSRRTTRTSSRRAAVRTSASSATPSSIECSSRAPSGRRARALDGEWTTVEAGEIVLACGRGALAGDPPALGHRARPRRRPAGRPAPAGPPGVFAVLPLRDEAKPADTVRSPHQRLCALLVRARRSRPQRHDDRRA